MRTSAPRHMAACRPAPRHMAACRAAPQRMATHLLACHAMSSAAHGSESLGGAGSSGHAALLLLLSPGAACSSPASRPRPRARAGAHLAAAASPGAGVVVAVLRPQGGGPWAAAARRGSSRGAQGVGLTAPQHAAVVWRICRAKESAMGMGAAIPTLQALSALACEQQSHPCPAAGTGTPQAC